MRAVLSDYHSGFLLLLLCTILPLSIGSTRIDGLINELDFFLSIDNSYTFQCPEDNCIYLPLVMGSVPEIDAPSGRWPHTYGQPFSVMYKYLGELDETSHRWRISFVEGISSWNSADTPITLYLYSQTENKIGMVDDEFEPVGFTLWFSAGDELLWAEVYGNYYWEDVFQWTDNQRRSIAAHEIGHFQGIGHIPRSFPIFSLMYDGMSNYEFELYFIPQTPDIALVNQVYP